MPTQALPEEDTAATPQDNTNPGRNSANIKTDPADKTRTPSSNPGTGSPDQAKVASTSQASSSNSSSGKSGGAATASNAVAKSAGGGTTVAVKAVSSFAGNHKGPLAAGGGVGLLLVILIGMFFALLPLKIESMMENIFEHRIGSRIEYYMEPREGSIVQKFLEANTGTDDAEFEKSIVATGQPIRDFYRTWRVNNFEDKWESQSNLRLQRNPDGSIDVYKDGELVDNISKPDAIDVINDAVDDMLRPWQFMQRMHLRTWMRNAYGITKWGYFVNITNKIKCKLTSCTDNNAAEDTFDDTSTADADAVDIQESTGALICGLDTLTDGPACDTDPDDPKNAEDNGADDIANDDQSQSGEYGDSQIEGAVSEGETQALDKVDAAADGTGPKVVDGVTVDASKSITEALLSKILPDEIAKQVATAVADLKGPLIVFGMLDMASRLDHFLWNGGADKVIVGTHEVEYAAQFAEWMTISSQWKSGQNVSGDDFNAAMQKTSGIENSAAFQQIYSTGTGGQQLDQVTDANGNITTDDEGRTIDQQSHPIEEEYQIIASIPVPAIGGSIHTVMNAWYISGGRIWGFIQKLVNSLLGWAFDIFKDWLKLFSPILYDALTYIMDHMADLLIKVMMLLVKPAVTGLETGADLFNDLDAGALVTGLGFARDLGAPQINSVGAAALQGAIGKAQTQQYDQMSIASRLFSPSFPSSLVNNIALAMPSTPSDALNDSVTYAASILSDPVSIFASVPQILGFVGPADAATNNPDSPQNNYGMTDWGYTPQQLQGNDTAALNTAWANATKRLGHTPTYGELELSDCPDMPNPAQDPNLCRLDIAVIQSLGAEYTTQLDGGLD